MHLLQIEGTPPEIEALLTSEIALFVLFGIAVLEGVMMLRFMPSELVVPIVRDGKLIAVLDIDSPSPARFSGEDEAGCVALGELLAKVL